MGKIGKWSKKKDTHATKKRQYHDANGTFLRWVHDDHNTYPNPVKVEVWYRPEGEGDEKYVVAHTINPNEDGSEIHGEHKTKSEAEKEARKLLKKYKNI